MGCSPRDLRAARALHTLLLTPIIVPVILVAIGVFYVYVKIKLVNTLAGMVLAHSMLAMPLVMLVVGSALKSFDMNQEMVARSLGASRARAFLDGDAAADPLRAGQRGAAVLPDHFDEVIMALFVSGGNNSTLTRNMFNALRDQIDPTIAAISTLMIIVTTLLLVVAQFYGRRRPD